MAIAGDTHNIPSRPIKLDGGRVVTIGMVTNKPRELVEQDIARAAQRLLAGETFEMYCSGPQVWNVQAAVYDLLAEQEKQDERME